MVYIFGDLHFSCLNPWNLAVGDKIINWFEKRFINERKLNSAVFLGDITEKDLNAGNVIDQVDHLFNFMSEHFQAVYILMGNHDLKLYRGELQYSLKFLQRKYQTVIISQPTDLIIDQTLFRCLPFIRPENDSLENYYSRLDYTKEKTADIVLGHWNLIDSSIGLPLGVSPEKLNAKNFILGHIHNRINSVYTGSLAPNKISEYTPDIPRVFKIVSQGQITEEPIPEFVRYLQINYPQPIDTEKSATIDIYTVNNVKSLAEAKSFYKDIYIKSIQATTEKEQKEAESIQSDFIQFTNNKESINQFLKETKYPMSRSVYRILQNLLKS